MPISSATSVATRCEIMHELGILDELLKRPHRQLRQFTAQMGNSEIVLADFTRLSAHCHFVALMPQWDFLDFLVKQAQRFSGQRRRSLDLRSEIRPLT